MEYRPIPNDHDGFREATGYAFSPESGPPDLDEAVSERDTVGDPRGLFADEALRAVCKHYWFDARLRGTRIPMAGLGAVATPPEYRRQGNVRRILEEALAEYRERDVSLSVLWPFEHDFYARMGWATANRLVVHEGPPDALAFARGEVDGEFVELDPDEYDRMDGVLDAYAADYELVVDRTEEWWRKRIFHARGGDPYVYGWERDGDLGSYLVYMVDEDGDRLHVLDSAYADHEARLANVGFLSNHDSQVEEVRLYEPVPDLLDVLPDPGEFETNLWAGAMARIVDVPAALAGHPAPADVEGSLRLRVEDPLVEWNDATFAVAFADDEVTVDRLGGAAEPDLELGIGALSQLFVGYRGIDDLVKTGEAEVRRAEVGDLLRAVFPGGVVFMGENF